MGWLVTWVHSTDPPGAGGNWGQSGGAREREGEEMVQWTERESKVRGRTVTEPAPNWDGRSGRCARLEGKQGRRGWVHFVLMAKAIEAPLHTSPDPPDSFTLKADSTLRPLHEGAVGVRKLLEALCLSLRTSWEVDEWWS
jgi:hypothetical protein